MTKNILVINPGSTSTKVAYYSQGKEVFDKSITHPMEELDKFKDVYSQLDMRVNLVKDLMKENHIDPKELNCVVGRGGLLPNVNSGGYLVNTQMVQGLKKGIASPHASNLGPLMADEIARPVGIPAFIYDCVTSNEFTEVAEITGIPGIVRHSMCHVLNQKAMAKKIAPKYGKTYRELRTIVAHLGGGISIGVHLNGRIVDCVRDDAGPFSPERSGGIPILEAIEMCFKPEMTKEEMVKRVRGMGGIKAYLGTTDFQEVEKMAKDGNQLAAKLYEAEGYQIAKGIGEMAPVLNCQIDCIILTGGMAYSKGLTDMITKRVGALAPVEIMAGQMEMEALYQGALNMINGEEEIQQFTIEP